MRTSTETIALPLHGVHRVSPQAAVAGDPVTDAFWFAYCRRRDGTLRAGSNAIKKGAQVRGGHSQGHPFEAIGLFTLREPFYYVLRASPSFNNDRQPLSPR